MKKSHVASLLYTPHEFNERLTTIRQKNMYIFLYSFEACQIYVVRDRQTEWGRQRQTAILTHSFFLWPYHLLLLLHFFCFSTRDTQPEAAVNRRPSGCSLWLQAGTDPFCLQLSPTDSNSLRPSSGVCIYHFERQRFPINHEAASAYLLRGILFRDIYD